MTETNYLHSFWTPALTDAFDPVLKAQNHGREAIHEAYDKLDEGHRLDLTAIITAGRVPMLATSAFVLPVLSPEGCQAILDRAYSYAWSENGDEPDAVRMREAVYAEADPEYGDFLRSVLMTGASPWMMMTRGRLPSQLASLQLAQYSADDRSGGNYHIDRDSNFSCVINLNPDEYEGGGTDIMDGLIGSFHIPKIPQGFGLFFDGREVFHRGAPVTKGTRKLLVIWAHNNADVW